MGNEWLNDITSELQKIISARDETKVEKPQLRAGERRSVAILFLDLKGFTAISEKLDPEELHKIIDQCFKIFTNDIEKFGGYVDKYEGDLIMALFGAKKSSEFDTELAVKAGLLMESHLEEINSVLKKKGITLAMRIGINYGMVVAAPVGKERPGDFTVYGDAVNLASRLESNAPVGKILISEQVYKHIKGNFECNSLGTIQVKGKSEPVSVYTVERPTKRGIQRWERAFICQKSPFVNRDKEQEQIKDYFSRVSISKPDGFTEMLLVQGMPGIGKSRLLYECIQACLKEGNQQIVLQGRCFAYGHSYHSLLELVWQGIEFITKISGKNDPREIIQELAQQLSEKDREIYIQNIPFFLNLLGIQKVPTSELDAKELQLKNFLSLKFFFNGLLNLAQSYYFLFIFDDVQWMDTASREAFIFLLEQLNHKALNGIILISREDFDFTKFIPRTLKCSIIRLNPLSRNDCGKLIEKTIGENVLPDELLDSILNLSQGNPYFLEEILLCLQERNCLLQKNGKWEWQGASSNLPIPATIESLLLSRVDCLPKPLKETIQIASVLGRTFDRKVLSKVLQILDKETDDLDNHLELLCKLGFFHFFGNEPNQLAFAQNLLQQVVYHSLLIDNRKIIHEISARAFQEIYPEEENASSIAYHYLNSAYPEKALKNIIITVQQWVRDFRVQEALTLLEQGLNLLKDKTLTDEQIDCQWQLLLLKEKITELTNQHQTREQVLSQLQKIASEQNNPSRIALTKDLTAWFEINLGKYEKAISTAQEILKIPEIKNTSLYPDAFHYLGLAYYNLGNYQSAQNYLNEALSLRVSQKDINGEAWTLSSLSTIHWRYGEYESAIKSLERSLKIREEQNYLRGMAHDLNNLGLVYFSIGNFSQAQNCFQKALELYKQIGDNRNQGNVLSNLNILFLYQGEIPQAIDYARKALELSKKYELFRLNINARIYLAKTLLECKDQSYFEEIEKLLDSALKDAQAGSNKQAILEARIAQAGFLMEKGLISDAFQIASLALNLMNEMGLVEEELYWLFSQLAFLLNKKSEAIETLKKAVDFIKNAGKKIKDKEFQKAFIQNNPYRRKILELAKTNQII